MPNAYQLQLADFSDEIDVVCPKCARRALVKGGKVTDAEAQGSIRCVCTHCGYNQFYSEREADITIGNSRGQLRRYPITVWGGEVDPYFHHPLWYMAPCLEGNIWAYNQRHLQLLENFIRASDRGRNGLPNKNNSIASRLPRWMSAAKNRTSVLKCIGDLKLKCILVLITMLSFVSCNSGATRQVKRSGLDPFANASRVELLRYNDRMAWWPKMGEGDQPLLEEGKLNIPRDSILARMELNSLVQTEWKQALYDGEICDENLVSYCYQPRHMLVFYEADDRVLGYIEICFSCENGEVSDGLRPVSFCAERMELLLPLADAL